MCLQAHLQATPVPCSQCRHRHAALLPPAAALAGIDTSFTWRPVTVRACLLQAARPPHTVSQGPALQGSFLQRVLDDLTQALARNERLLVVAASTFIMSTSHTALRPVMPLFVKVCPIQGLGKNSQFWNYERRLCGLAAAVCFVQASDVWTQPGILRVSTLLAVVSSRLMSNCQTQRSVCRASGWAQQPWGPR